jgi:hypothetical protein
MMTAMIQECDCLRVSSLEDIYILGWKASKAIDAIRYICGRIGAPGIAVGIASKEVLAS